MEHKDRDLVGDPMAMLAGLLFRFLVGNRNLAEKTVCSLSRKGKHVSGVVFLSKLAV